MKRIRLDLWEVSLLLFLFVLVTVALVQPRDTEPTELKGPTLESSRLLSDFEARYRTRVSQNAEEWIIRDFFQDRRAGTFLDVGANSYKIDSTTYTLDVMLGWSGVAVEPQPEFAADYKRFRPRTTFVQAFASDKTGTATLYVPRGGSALASGDPNYVPSAPLGKATMQVPMLTLDAILENAGIHRIDFVSMDIENAEPVALKGFTIERYAPELVCIESHIAVRQAILNYFAEHGYVLVGKYWQADLLNMYFTPLQRAQGLLPGV